MFLFSFRKLINFFLYLKFSVDKNLQEIQFNKRFNKAGYNIDL